MIYGYVRVSTDKQVLDNQKFEISEYCKKKGISIDKWIEEYISGTKDYQKRRLGPLLKKLKKNDVLLCSELSRLGRTLFMIMDILNICMRKGTKVWTIKENYRLGDDIESKVLAFAFGLSAEIERNLISQRTKESLMRLKAEGKILGRPKGSKNSHSVVDGHIDYIKEKMKEGMKMKLIAKKLHIHPNTLTKYTKIYCPFILWCKGALSFRSRDTTRNHNSFEILRILQECTTDVDVGYKKYNITISFFRNPIRVF